MDYWSPIQGISGWYGSAWGLPLIPIRVDPPADPHSQSKPGVPQAGDQASWLSGVGGAMNWVQGYAKAPPGNLAVWRLMDANPTLTLARVLVCGPILAGARDFEIQPGKGVTPRRTPRIGDGVISDPLDKRKDFLASVLNPLLFDLVKNCLRSLSLGNYSHEVVWGVGDGISEIITQFKPLLPERTQLIVDQHGDFCGVLNLAAVNGESKLYGRFVMNYANDCEAGYPYGRPRHENCRQEWWDKLQKKMRLADLDMKAAGVTIVVKGPAGTGRKDSNGNAIDGPAPAMMAATEIAKQRPVWVTKAVIGPPDPDKLGDPSYVDAYAKLFELSAFEFEKFDWEHTGPASAAVLEGIRYLDIELMRAWHRPEREAMEAAHGSRADGEAHGDIGDQDSDMVHADICRCISRGPVNDLLVRNFGEDAKDSIALVPASVRSEQVEAVTAFIEKLMGNPTAAQDLYKKLDKEKVFADMHLPLREDVDANEDPPEPTPPTAPGGTGPPEKGKPDKAEKVALSLSADADVSDLLDGYQDGGEPLPVGGRFNGNGHDQG